MTTVLDEHRDALQAHFPIPPARPNTRRRLSKTASGVAALLLLAGMAWWADPTYQTAEYSTRIGQRSELALADGSRVTLDTDTRLSVQWRLRSRHIDLQQGRAQFDVSPAIVRPFHITAGAAQVRVVGTRFDVWRQPAATEVSVYEGRVQVWRTGQSDDSASLLQAGQQLSVDAAASTQTLGQPAAFDTTLGTAWQQGQFIFRNTPLQTALAQIQRYHPKPIHWHSASPNEQQITGVFDSSNISQLLGLLPRILPVTVERLPDGSIQIDALP